MKILFLDLHVGKDLTEALKIFHALQEYGETSMDRLFSPDFSYDSLSSYKGIVLSGLDKSRLLTSPKMERLRNRLRKVAENGTFILGICGGHHVLATAYGYKVEEIEPEVGWPPVYLTEIGKRNSLFRDLGESIRPFQYHNKAVFGVEESRILARNDCCVQAVLYEDNVYGIQFHPEDTSLSGLKFLIKSGHESISNIDVPQKYEDWKIFRNFVDIVRSKSKN